MDEKNLKPIYRADGGEARFHGTEVEGLQQFDPSKSRTAKYHYLADSPETARAYGKHVYKVKLNPKNMIEFHPEEITPKHVQVVNELAERLGEDPEYLMNAITFADGSFYGRRGSLQDNVMDELKDMGYDAVRFPDPVPGGGWDMSTVILNNDVVGSMEKHQDDINKAEGGSVDDQDEGIVAYHGSPHDFDQFDLSKIGTGEGAQAYGHGLYFAENENIAKSYRDALTRGAGNMTIEGRPFSEFHGSSDPEKFLKAKLALNMLHDDRDVQQAIDWQIQQTKGKLSSRRLLPEDVDPLMEDLQRLNQMKQKPPKIEKNPGHMYEVRIAAHPDHFLDWDKPLVEQPHVMQAIDQHIGDPEIVFDQLFGHREATGRDLHERFGGEHKPAAVAQRLSDMGIKGIKYLDAGSRSSTDAPTRNYVVFDDKHVSVRRKYEQGGAVQAMATGGEVDEAAKGLVQMGGASVSRESRLANWYKDSKVRDKESKPLIVYHHGDFSESDHKVPDVGPHGMHFGTKQAATERAYGKPVDDFIKSVQYDQDSGGKWHWFANDGTDSAEFQDEGFQSKDHAKRHAENFAQEQYSDIDQSPEEMGNMTAAYLNIKNPKRVADQGHDWSDSVAQAKQEGYDGIVYRNKYEDKGSDSYVVFHPSQVKSINAESFDPSNPDITKAAGGEVDPTSDIPQIDNAVSVFPKPQRMFPEDAPVPGGMYLNAATKEDMTGHKAAMASIGVQPGGKPYFRASPDSVDETGTPGRGSAMAKTNLFKQKAGWKWAQAPEGHEATDTIVSVQHRGQHHYTLNAHFPKGVDLARYEKSPTEPRLRPTTQGNVTLGPQVGSILVRGKEHPVYEHVIVKNMGGEVSGKKASGGSAVATMRRMSDPAVNEAIRVINKSGSSPRDAVTLSKRLLGRQ